MKQFRSPDIASTLLLLLNLMLQDAHKPTHAPCGTTTTFPTHTFGDMDLRLDSDLRASWRMQVGTVIQIKQQQSAPLAQQTANRCFAVLSMKQPKRLVMNNFHPRFDNVLILLDDRHSISTSLLC